MNENERLKRVQPRVDRSRSRSFRSISTLYLEDVEAIHDVMKDHIREGSGGDVVDRLFNVIEQNQRSFQNVYDEVAKFYEKHGETLSIPRPSTIAEHSQERPKVYMSTDEFELDNLSQLRSLKRDYIKAFTIHILNPRIYLKCDRTSFYLSVDNNDPDSTDAFEKITDILMKRRSRLISALDSGFFLAFLIIFLYVVSGLLARVYDRLAVFSVGGMTSTIFVALLFLVSQSLWYRRRGVVIPRYEMDAPPFWRRNSNVFGVAVVTAVITAVITILISALVGLF